MKHSKTPPLPPSKTKEKEKEKEKKKLHPEEIPFKAYVSYHVNQ
jgi:hypothetical protein